MKYLKSYHGIYHVATLSFSQIVYRSLLESTPQGHRRQGILQSRNNEYLNLFPSGIWPTDAHGGEATSPSEDV
ncbi:hypothetical protein Y1Q_0015701 [Alligator mississippiensis]|uniref:Uncharacterized protein n=1 Tax=Alligator mississippiensis TaxID=8496 RepID=A0A151NNR9_ALLMI|nr:hypothetical protein Y1Q_0015701 [Alligator mississippiensis]